jgi:hypothetical protein
MKDKFLVLPLIFDSILWADIHADATEYALRVFHTPLPDHIAHIKPHRAVL